MKRYTYILCALVLFCLNLYAQSNKPNVTLERLVGTTWLNETDEECWILNFTSTESLVSKIYFKEEKEVSEHKLEYYLSETPLTSYDVDSFDSQRVGMSLNGRYIIIRSTHIFEHPIKTVLKSVDYYLIESIEDDELKLFHKTKPKSVGGRDISITFKRMKK